MSEADAHAADAALARACAAGDVQAIAEVERRFGDEMTRALARLGIDTETSAEIRQALREKLFVGKGGEPPAIATYSGRGPLGGWLRALVVHAAMSAHRAAKRRAQDRTDSVLSGIAADEDPELAQIRARYAGPFREAFRDALASLSPRERNVLRLVYVEGLTVEQAGAAYGVHRVSVSRWLGQTRQTLLERTRALLAKRLALGASELASVTRMCLSQIDVSLDRLLRED
jgi:RNA polymerase sigma-70 factor (ECF subfamily)